MAQGTANPSPTPFDRLPPPPTYSTGVFRNPNTATTQSFTEGSQINVTWETNYEAVNLYFIFDGQYGTPITVTTGQSQSWFEFELQCQNNNCSVPYSFRAVDAYGSQQDQKSGGFYTGQFWLAPASGGQTTPSIVPSSTGTSTITSTRTASTASSDTSISASPSTTASEVLSTPITADEPSSTASSTDPTPASSTTPMGIGIGVGVGGAIVLTCGLLFFWLRHKKAKPGPPQSHITWHSGPHPHEQNPVDVYPRDQKQEYEVATARTPKMFHEVPGMTEPCELPGSVIYKR